jgi:hypothetical protein
MTIMLEFTILAVLVYHIFLYDSGFFFRLMSINTNRKNGYLDQALPTCYFFSGFIKLFRVSILLSISFTAISFTSINLLKAFTNLSQVLQEEQS